MSTARISIFLIIVALIAGLVGCTAEPTPTQCTLTISSTDGGDSSCVPPLGCTCGEGTKDSGGVSVPEECLCAEGTEVSILASPAFGYRFTGWTGNVDTIGDVDAAETTIIMNDDYSITANFVKQYDLTISSTAGGFVTVPGEGMRTYDEGEVVNLVANAENGYHFVNWTGDVETIADVKAATTTITMLSDYTITANFAADLYFRIDTGVALNGPATLLPEERNPCVWFEATTNMVVDKVRVDLPDARSMIVPPHSDVFDPEAGGTTILRFYTCEPGMPITGGEYVLTGLDVAGEPVPGARNTDIWVGVDPPDPPTNVRAEVTQDGILIEWAESPIIPGSFEPAAKPQLGAYQLWISVIETWESVYGAGGISTSSHIIPQDKADFVEGKDRGISLSDMEDGTYCLGVCVHSVAPEGTLGKGCEYMCSDPGQAITFTIEDGEVTIQ